MAWAKRMTCGYCSVEQAVGERCGGCGKKVASTAANPSGRNTRFWCAAFGFVWQGVWWFWLLGVVPKGWLAGSVAAHNPPHSNHRREGGQGCRDPSAMSRRDPKRYRNGANKTKSAKSKRVGPKPWS